VICDEGLIPVLIPVDDEPLALLVGEFRDDMNGVPLYVRQPRGLICHGLFSLSHYQAGQRDYVPRELIKQSQYDQHQRDTPDEDSVTYRHGSLPCVRLGGAACLMLVHPVDRIPEPAGGHDHEWVECPFCYGHSGLGLNDCHMVAFREFT
jgi:hypothetical protein